MDLSKKILSDIIIHMKYAKFIPEKKRRETWEELVERNKQMHLEKFPDLKSEIDWTYDFVLDKKVLPSMRSLQFAGKSMKLNPVRMFNCSLLAVDHYKAFNEAMFLLLSGSGVGYSVQQHHVEKLPEIKKPNPKKVKRYVIGDSIEGWADSVKMLIKSYFGMSDFTIDFDYSDIRPKGAILVTSGGKAPGAQPLKECLTKIKWILDSKKDGEKLKTIEVHSIMCHIADAVLSGGIRRAAMISLFSINDEEMMTCKSGNWWEQNPHFGRANNSVVLVRSRAKKEDFDMIWEKIKASGAGEPGVLWTNNAEVLCNPCNEISLRINQFCNLTEVNVSDIESQEDFNNRVKAATILGTLQASYTNFHYLRDIWKKNTDKDALLGVSMTGIASMEIFKYNIEQAVEVAKECNEDIASKIGINKAARITCVKPAGTTSLVLGSSSGIHAWHNDYYIRRVRVGKNESIYTYLSIHNPELLEDDIFRPNDTSIINIPQKAPENSVTRNETALELLSRVKEVSERWIKSGFRNGYNNHNVSCTISVKKDEWDEVKEWMWNNRESYNGISILPHNEHTYQQAPFEDCTIEKYEELVSKLQNINLSDVYESFDNTQLNQELACGSGGCEIK